MARRLWLLHSQIRNAHIAAGSARAAERGRFSLPRADPPRSDRERATFLAHHQEPYRELVAVLWDTSGQTAAERAFAVAEASRARALLDALRASGLAVGEVAPITWQDVRRWLTPHELLLTFVSSEDRLFGFAVSRDRLLFRELLSGKAVASLAERVGFFRQLVQESASAPELLPAGSALSTDLVAPLLAEASRNVEST